MRLIHSADIPKPYLEWIDGLFPNIVRIPVPRSKDVYPSIASHPDIFIFAADCDTLVSSAPLFDTLAARLGQSGIRVVRAQTTPHGRYPDTASLNAAIIGAYVFHNAQYTDAAIRDLVREKGLGLINVNQGYTRCSIVPVAKNALITCDMGIAKAARAMGLRVKLISSGNVALPGQEYGFIGGASGVTPDGKIIFLGDITQHPDCAEIDSFLNELKIEYTYPHNLPLLDAGSLIFTR